jgi:hypothetical protein
MDDESAGLGLRIIGPPEAMNRGQFEKGADARFIAAAREDVPALLAEVRYLRRRLEAAERLIEAESPEYRVRLHPVGCDCYLCARYKAWHKIVEEEQVKQKTDTETVVMMKDPLVPITDHGVLTNIIEALRIRLVCAEGGLETQQHQIHLLRKRIEPLEEQAP